MGHLSHASVLAHDGDQHKHKHAIVDGVQAFACPQLHSQPCCHATQCWALCGCVIYACRLLKGFDVPDALQLAAGGTKLRYQLLYLLDRWVIWWPIVLMVS